MRHAARIVCVSSLGASLLLLVAPARAATSLDVVTGTLHLTFAPREPRLLALEVRASRTGSARQGRFALRLDSDRLLRVSLTPRAAGATPEDALRIEDLTYTIAREEHPDRIVLRYRAPLGGRTCEIEHRYVIPREGYLLEHAVLLRGAGAPSLLRDFSIDLELRGSPLEARADSGGTGWSHLSERVRWVAVDPDGAREVSEPEGLTLGPGRWVGARNRYWTLLWESPDAVAELDPGSQRMRIASVAGASGRLYLGPIDAQSLSRVDPSLGELLFSGQWEPVRSLARGLMGILDGLIDLTHGRLGWSIVLLALTVQALCFPLQRIAGRWQRDVDRTRVRLEPHLAEARRRYRGEERSRRIFAVYRAHRVHPLYGLKSLLGVAIQVPLFFAAYHLLDEHPALAQASFLWIGDLSRPDHVASLPFSLPLLGDGLNLLPLLMTAATCLASRVQVECSLPGPLRPGRRRGLYAMAVAFLLLFYTFPAGMVLYWTTNNLISLTRSLAQYTVRDRLARPLEVRDVPAP